ncbi:hypothetical protein [Solibacillus isronensis]|uniref:hypothetical protein n=1 Tax=Solibacillus isronensis TaxID=412383 RepID=UPI0039A1BD53
MSKQFEFSDFVDEFRVKFELPESVIAPGYYDDDGEWVPPNTAAKLVEKEGIILPLVENEEKYAENGVYTTKGKKLYTIFPIEEGTIIQYNGDSYTVQAFKDYSEYADVFIYLMRWREKGGA